MATTNNVRVLETDINSAFDEHVSLYNLIGQHRACQALQTLIDEHHWNKTQGIPSRIKPVMIYGKHSCSVVAKAYANTLGAVDYNEVMGCLIGYGVNLQDCFNRMDEHSAYFISDIDKMVYYFKHCLLLLVKDQIIEIPPIPAVRAGETKNFAGQLVLSAVEPTKISSKLEQYCSAVIRLVDYQDKDIEDILIQRIIVCGIVIKDEIKVMDAIVRAGNGDVKLAIQMLDWANRCCRSEGKETILLRHLNKALRMWG